MCIMERGGESRRVPFHIDIPIDIVNLSLGRGMHVKLHFKYSTRHPRKAKVNLLGETFSFYQIIKNLCIHDPYVFTRSRIF